MVERGGERLRVAGDVHQPRLEDGAERDAGADQEDVCRQRPEIAGGKRKHQQRDRREQQDAPAVGISARSAKRGTNRLPSVAPMPNTARKSGMTRG